MPEENAEDEEAKPTPEYHSSFNSEHADLVLQSKDGIKFRVHSQILRVASTVFNDMLSVKRDESETASSPILLEESALVLSTILDLIYPQHVLPASAALTAHLIYDAGLAARKYDIDAVVDSLQNCLYTREVMQPLSLLQKFGVARRLGWDEVAKRASTDTLAMDLSTRAAQKALATLDTSSVLAFQGLRHRRKIILVNSLPSVCVEPPFPTTDRNDLAFPICYPEISNVVNHVPNVDCEAIAQLKDLSAWSKLKFAVVAEMEKCPLGSHFLVDDFFDNVEFSGLWSARFSCVCWGSTSLDKVCFRSRFRSVLAKLPNSISSTEHSD